MPDEDIPKGFTPEELSRIAALEVKRAAEGEESEHRLEVEIYDEYVTTVAASGRRITIPKPTQGMLQLYDARREYFEDRLGLGRLLWMLERQRAENYAVIRRIRSGEDIPEAEAAAYLDDIAPEDVGDYYVTFWGAAKYGDEETKKKVESFLLRRVALSRNSSSLPAGPSSTLPTG